MKVGIGIYLFMVVFLVFGIIFLYIVVFNEYLLINEWVDKIMYIIMYDLIFFRNCYFWFLLRVLGKLYKWYWFRYFKYKRSFV